MSISLENLGLYTDYYELVMAQGYYIHGKYNEQAVFDYFFRKNPFESGFTVFAGLADLLDLIASYRFSEDDLLFLRQNGFRPEFIDYLRGFVFKGSIHSVREGEFIFPGEPILRVEGRLIETQLIESLILNILNYESLIATKACRIKMATGKKIFADFGLRRAPGLGAIHATRAAFIGGASSTSNVLAAKLFGIPPSGTQAHSWIQSFQGEAEAFDAFLKVNPDNAVLLVDTYDTLQSGVPNAIRAAKKHERKGHRLSGIRLDSGDLAYLSRHARKMLDGSGLGYVKIFASNQLNEKALKSLLQDQGAPIDAFGVGTELVTGKPDAALDGVYKLAEIDGKPTMKFSDNIEKETLPGKKNIYRFFSPEDNFYCDGICLENEAVPLSDSIYNPLHPEKKTNINGLIHEKLLKKVLENGIITEALPDAKAVKNFHDNRILHLPEEQKRFTNPLVYPTAISQNLLDLRNRLYSERLVHKK